MKKTTLFKSFFLSLSLLMLVAISCQPEETEIFQENVVSKTDFIPQKLQTEMADVAELTSKVESVHRVSLPKN